MRTIVALMLLFVGAAGADIILWRFEDHRVVSPSGRWCAIITRDKGRVHFEIYERPTRGVEPLAEVECPWRRTGRKLQARAGDRLIGCGTAETIPFGTMFTETPPRLVFVDSDRFGRGRLVTLIDQSGRVLKRHDQKSLFPSRKRAFRSSVSTTTWECGHFVDRDRLVIIVPHGYDVAAGHQPWDLAEQPHELLAVALESGRVFRPEPECLLRFMTDRKSALREAALIVAGKAKPRGFLSIAERIAFDATDDWTIRMCAAEAAMTIGSTRNFRPLFLAAAKPSNRDGWARAHAIRRLGRVVGISALPMLRSILEEGDTRPNHPWDVSEALDDLGPSIAPTMIAWLADEANHEDLRMTAAVQLSALKPREAVEPLYRAVSHGPQFVGMWAITALREIGAPDRVDRFCTFLRNGGPCDGELGWYFEQHPTERARAALEIANARLRGEDDHWGQAPYEAALERLDAVRERKRTAHLRKPFACPPVAPGARIVVPGTGVAMVPPAGFTATGGGFEHSSSGAWVSVSPVPWAFDEPASWFDAASLEKRGKKLESRREGTLDGFEAVLLHVTSRSLVSWTLVLGDDRKSVTVTATMPRSAASKLAASLRRALMTVRWKRER